MDKSEEFAKIMYFFKSLIEGKSEISFKAFFKKNNDYLKQALERPVYLRLKHDPMKEIPRILDNQGIVFEENPLAMKMENYYLQYSDSALDDKGRLNESYKKQLFNGAIGAYLEGDRNAFESKLNKYLKKTNSSKEATREERLTDLLFWGEIEIEYGDYNLGKLITKALSELPTRQLESDSHIYSAKRIVYQLEKNS